MNNIDSRIIDVFNRVINSEYLYICDDELYNRNRYIEEITEKQNQIAQEFRLQWRETIDKLESNLDIKLEDDYYISLTEEGNKFIDKINKSIVEMTQRQAEIKSDIPINLDMEVELNFRNYDDMKKIFLVVREYADLDEKALISKFLKKVKEKTLKLSEDDGKILEKEAILFIENISK